MSIRFARSATRTSRTGLGRGPLDILLFIGEYLPVDALDEEPRLRALRCAGWLDRTRHRVQPPRRRALRSAPTACSRRSRASRTRSPSSTHVGVPNVRRCSVGTPPGTPTIRLAAEHPDRISALVADQRLRADHRSAGLSGRACRPTSPRRPRSRPSSTDESDRRTQTRSTSSASSRRPSPTTQRFRAWWDQAGNRACRARTRSRTSGTSSLQSDERDQLPKITAPTLVIHRRDERSRREPAATSPTASTARGSSSFPGDDLMWWVGDSDPILDEIEIFLAGMGAALADAAQARDRPVLRRRRVDGARRAARRPPLARAPRDVRRASRGARSTAAADS